MLYTNYDAVLDFSSSSSSDSKASLCHFVLSSKMEVLKAIAVLVCVCATAALAGDIDYTPEEIKALEKFRPQVIAAIKQDFMKTDHYLMRYLKAEKMDVEKAKQRLQRTLEWRKTENIDNILNEDLSPSEQCIPMHWLGQDNEGRPLLYHQFGTWDIRKCALSGNTQKMIRYLTARKFELGEKMVYNSTDPSGRKVAKMYLLANLAGFNLRQGACLGCITFVSATTSIFEKYYIGLCHRVMVINVGQVFEGVLGVIRNLLGEENRKILKVFGHDKNQWGPVLKRAMDTSQLPVEIGGKRRLS